MPQDPPAALAPSLLPLGVEAEAEAAVVTNPLTNPCPAIDVVRAVLLVIVSEDVSSAQGLGTTHTRT